jgi:hypothetical protein
MLLPEAAEQSDVFAVRGRGIGITQGTRGELDPIANGEDVVGIEDIDHESLRMEVAQSIEDGIEDLTRFLRIERRAAEGRRERLVGRLEDSVEHNLAEVIGASEVKEFDQIRVTKLADSMPEIERRSAFDDGFGH